MTHRSFLGHFEELCLMLEATREFVRTDLKAFIQSASPGTMARTERTITKIQVQMAEFDNELNAIAYDLIRILRQEIGRRRPASG